MPGKENKPSSCSRVSTLPRRSVSSPFSSASKKAASSGVRLPSPARRSITVPLITNPPAGLTVPQLRRSIVNPVSNVLKEEQNIPKIYKCHIKPQAVKADKIVVVKSINKRNDGVSKSTNQPLRPHVVQKNSTIEPTPKTVTPKTNVNTPVKSTVCR